MYSRGSHLNRPVFKGSSRLFLSTLLSAVVMVLLFVSGFLSYAAEGPEFSQYFEDKTLRVDYYHTADKSSEVFALDKLYQQGVWAGNPKNLIDSFNNGLYYVKIYHVESNTLIFSKGFGSYCSEYMATDMAAQGIKKTYHETVLLPFPKEKINFTIERRDRQNQLHCVFQQVIDPQSVDISKESLMDGVTITHFINNGSPHNNVDLAFIAEGYTEKEKDKFLADLKTMTDLFFNQEPYKSHHELFNVYGLFKVSKESGTDQPVENSYVNTVVGSTFNALGLDRYNLTEENRMLRDIAAHVPYDAILIMVNHARYGGGGIYNSYCLFTLNPERNAYLMLHEFGHSFGGLADEYYAATVAYNEFFPTGIEPTEPNITALLDPQNIKWKSLVSKNTAIPTPWDKEKFDKMERKDKKNHLASLKYQGKIGAFEGAGYASTGLYRPAVDCLMFTSTLQPYCKVCEAALLRMIYYYANPK